MKKIPFLILFAVLALTSLAENATFNIATYNIRQANHSDSVAGNGWGRREPHVASLIRFHQFDIFGTQEGFRFQLDRLRKDSTSSARIFSMWSTTEISGCRRLPTNRDWDGTPSACASVPGDDSATNLPDGNFSTSISTWIMSAPWPAPKAPV